MPAKDLGTIDDFIREVGAWEKLAETPLSETGSVGGETSHPSKNVDDRLQEPSEGERFRENTTDVKKEQGAVSVEVAPDNVAKSAAELLARFAKKAEGSVNPPGAAAGDQLQIGMNAQPTGEDPAHETGSVKADKEDGSVGGESSHPARTDNDQLDGHKYAADLAAMPLEKLAEEVRTLGNEVCAALTVSLHARSKQASAPPRQPAQAARDAYKAGWELAGVSAGLDKQAADALVQDALYDVVKTAYDDGHNTADFLDQYLAEKRAGGPPEEMGGPPPGAGGPPPGAGGPPPGGPPGGGGEELMSALGGAPAPGPGPGGPPDGGGGEPDGDEGGAGLEQLQQLLDALGVTPEELVAALQGGAGGAGGPPPGAGGPPPGAGEPPPGAGGPPPGAGGPPPKQAAAKAGAADKSAEEVLKELLARSRKGGR